MNNFKEIYQQYQEALPLILEIYPRTEPYFYPFYDLMTPIERNVWVEIRSAGLPMYMQFPALNYFIDFADPVKKVGIEADGKEFHQDRLVEDTKRQSELEAAGWTIYRVKGGDTIDVKNDKRKYLGDPLIYMLNKIIKEHYPETIQEIHMKQVEEY